MENNYTIRDFHQSDIDEILEIFNIFARTSSAVYSEYELEKDQFEKLLEPVKRILILQNGKKVIGFGFIDSYKPFPNFDHTGVLTYFIKPEYTGNGLGTKLLNKLILTGKEKGITNYLAHISSKNIQSLKFHKKHGFEEVGKFKNIGMKFCEPFDVIWMQKQY